MAVLEVEDLQTVFPLGGSVLRAVDGVTFTLDGGRVLGLVGESGSGKSMIGLSLMRLVPAPGSISGGAVRFLGRDLLTLSERGMRTVRGAGLAMVFQEPMTALNPVLTVGRQIAEAVGLHRAVGRRAAWQRAVELLDEVGIPEAERRARDYPHQLSGGMRQRVMIAMAISCAPQVLIADEPTTALDVTIQAAILALLRTLCTRHGMALLLITHDLAVVAEQADEVAIMYAGRIVEHAPAAALFAEPLHPYTQALVRSMPELGRRRARLDAIPGQVPDLLALPSGCAFRDRCPRAIPACGEQPPALAAKRPGRLVACLRV